MRFEFQEGIGMAVRKEVFRRRGVIADALDARAGRRARRRHQGRARSRARVDGSTERCGMDLGLKGKVAMVAGASRGLGYAVARGLAAEGVSVSISSRDEPAIADAARRIGAETGSPTLGTAVDVRKARITRRVARPHDCRSSVGSTCST